MGRYTVAGPDGTGIEVDGRFLAWAGSRTSCRVIVSELHALLDRAEAADAKVAELLGQVPADDLDAALWTAQVGTPCGRVGDELVAVVPESMRCPDGWEWRWSATDWQRRDMNVFVQKAALAYVRRIPAPTPPPVEVGQWRQLDPERRVKVYGFTDQGDVVALEVTGEGVCMNRYAELFTADGIAALPICDAPEGMQ